MGFSKAISLAFLMAASQSVPCFSSDWGYEGAPEPIVPERAVALPLKRPEAKPAPKTPAQKAPHAQVNSQPQKAGAPSKERSAVKGKAPNTVAPAAAAVKPDPLRPSLAAWVQIYQMAGARDLNDDEKARLTKALSQRSKQDASGLASVEAPLSFWPRVKTYVADHPEQKENYQSLMKALLRFRQRDLTARLGQGDASAQDPASDESNLIGELLGPVRLAADGSTPLTSDAVDAYADMACFLYEQRHPGKTIDALDNRAVFATVIGEKFRNAPSDRDRKAMAGFDLTWAKFKIIWTGADAGTRKQLLDRLENKGANSASEGAVDPTLNGVLKYWPSAHLPSDSSASIASLHK
jgi:hypothetical protein